MRAFALFLVVIIAARGAGYNADPMHVGADSPIVHKLLVPGEAYHGGEVKAKSGERWLGLFRTTTGYRTAVVTVKITPVADPVMAGLEPDGTLTAKRVMISEPGEQPIFLLKGFQQFAHRVVRSVFDGSFDLRPSSISSLQFGDRKVELQVLPSGKTDKIAPDETVTIYQVNLGQGEVVTPLPLVVTDYNQVRLLWAGDLDGDGKLDLLFEDSGYNWGSKRLFLSSAAKSGELVAEVAQFYTTGC